MNTKIWNPSNRTLRKPSRVSLKLEQKKHSIPKDARFVLWEYSKWRMGLRNISRKEIFETIKRFDSRRFAEDGRIITEKMIDWRAIRTVYSYREDTKQVFVISCYGINKSKYERGLLENA